MPRMSRRRKFELSMQCWLCMYAWEIDSGVRKPVDSAVLTFHWRRIISQYAQLAGVRNFRL
jgi:hypothetical protein